MEADPWASASWEGAEAAALAVGARMSLEERLQWLEQATASARSIAGGVRAVDALPPVGDVEARIGSASSPMAEALETATSDLDDLPEPLEPEPGIELPSAALARLRRDER